MDVSMSSAPLLAKTGGWSTLSFSGQLDAEIGQLKKPGFALSFKCLFQNRPVDDQRQSEIGSVDGV